MKKSAPISIRISPDLKDAIVKLAEADKRSVSTYIEIVLEKHVAEAQASAKPKRAG